MSKNTKRGIIILVIMLVVGFASVSTTLLLNGDIAIGTKADDFDVIFKEALLNEGMSKNVIISEDKKSITFVTDKLTKEGDTVVLDYKVKNNSTQYGANVTINCNNYGNEYIEITGEFDGKAIPLENPIEMEAQEIKNGFIKAEIVKVYGGEDDSISLTCTIVANATSKDKVTEYIPDVYQDDVLNGADPVLVEGLVPVTIDNNGIVTVADIEDKWYSYEEKEWANAVILSDDAVYNVGDEIPEEKIESYFVWIPRYRYQVFDEGKYTTQTADSKPSTSIAKEIQIVFESKDETPSTGSTKGSWLTHPAFINFDVNGLWVGKFETGYKGATSKEEAQVNAVDFSKVIVKPNVYSWRNSTVGNMFKTAYNYKREMDSHMMKNTEWGAVAYLSHSKYGINEEININNNANYLTGYSAVDGTDQSSYPGTSGTDATKTLAYNTPTGYKASTTGNITGVYDMSGGAYEYMASYMDGYGVQNSANTKVASGFTAVELTTYAVYLDKYPNTSTITSGNNRILGDATGEMGPFYYYADKDELSRYHNNWYADHSVFIDSTFPWFFRSGLYVDGVRAGQFYFGRSLGDFNDGGSFRLVLSPQ